ncbi:MAG: hypothetical protein GY725_20760 [bacterium]|nr:hypothetical protein [bacterium]
MEATEMIVTPPDSALPDSLVAQFRDEETDVWVRASIRIGQRGRQAEPILHEFLSTTANLHAHRHAWCVLAAYLDTMTDEVLPSLRLVVKRKQASGGANDVVAEIAPSDYVSGWLSSLVLEGVRRDPDLTLGELTRLRTFGDLREERLQSLMRRLERVQGNEKAVAQVRLAAELWQNDLTIASDERINLGGSLPWDIWIAASFIAGATPDLMERLGVPLDLLLRALIGLAAEGGERLAFVANVPRLLSRLVSGDPVAVSFGELLVANVPQPQKIEDHWINYVDDLMAWVMSVDSSLYHRLTKAIVGCVSAETRPLMETWFRERSESSAINLARQTRDRFCDTLCWRELTQRQQGDLAVFCHVMQRPRVDSACERFTLSHRIQLTYELIQRWRTANPEVVLALVRLFKRLLYEEIRPGRQTSSRIRRHQIYLIRSLVTDWNLRGTLPKDLATSATRVLVGAYRDAEQNSRSQAAYLDLLYTLLSALPESSLVREMHLYAQQEAVERDLQQLADSLDEMKIAQSSERRFAAYQSYLDSVFLESRGATIPDPAALRRLVGLLARESPGQQLGEAEKAALSWLLEKHQRWILERDAGFLTRRSKSFEYELNCESESRTSLLVENIGAILASLATRDKISAEETANPAAVLDSLRGTFPIFRSLQEKCRAALPLAERELVTLELNAKVRKFEERVEVLTAVIDEENEERAKMVVNKQEPSDGACGRLVSNWMLRRYMLRELAPEKAWLITRLLDWRFVLSWILLPFLASGVILHLLDSGMDSRQAQLFLSLPFLLIVGLNVCAYWAYFASMPEYLPGGVPRASLLVPQMVGALFLGVVQSFSADENWSTAFLANPVLRLLKIGLFIAVSYFFVRYVMLRGQSPAVEVVDREGERRAQNKILRRRATSLMSLGLWQAFALVTLFSLFEGTTMSKRAGLAEEPQAFLAQELNQLIPARILVELGHPTLLEFVILPWAILTWTVQLFFFSAIFERIMSKN